MNIGDQVVIARHAKTNAYKRGEIVSRSTRSGTDIYGVLFADLDETYFYADYEVMPYQVAVADTREAYARIKEM